MDNLKVPVPPKKSGGKILKPLPSPFPPPTPAKEPLEPTVPLRPKFEIVKGASRGRFQLGPTGAVKASVPVLNPLGSVKTQQVETVLSPEFITIKEDPQ